MSKRELAKVLTQLDISETEQKSLQELVRKLVMRKNSPEKIGEYIGYLIQMATKEKLAALPSHLLQLHPSMLANILEKLDNKSLHNLSLANREARAATGDARTERTEHSKFLQEVAQANTAKEVKELMEKHRISGTETLHVMVSMPRTRPIVYFNGTLPCYLALLHTRIHNYIYGYYGKGFDVDLLEMFVEYTNISIPSQIQVGVTKPKVVRFHFYDAILTCIWMLANNSFISGSRRADYTDAELDKMQTILDRLVGILYQTTKDVSILQNIQLVDKDTYDLCKNLSVTDYVKDIKSTNSFHNGTLEYKGLFDFFDKKKPRSRSKSQ